MNILIILIGASLIVAVLFLAAFIFAVKKGQYDDTYSPAHRILFENTIKPKTKEHTNEK